LRGNAKSYTFARRLKDIIMAAHHKKEEEENYDFVYYLVGLVSGLFTGAILEVGMLWALVGGLLGLLTAAFYVNVLTKGREV
jgi:hypothetical protein